MKTIIAAALLLLSLALPAAAEVALPQGVIDLCDARYPAYIIAAHDGWGDEARGQYALVLTDGEDNILCIAEKSETDSAYAFTVDNPNALREGAEIPSLLIDTGGDSLYYSYTDGNTKSSYASFKSGGEWSDVSIIHQDFSHTDYEVDTLVFIQDGFLTYDRRQFDKLENPMEEERGFTQPLPIPVSPAFEANMKLAAFDIDSVSPDGWMIPVAEGVCHGLIEEGDMLLQVDVQSEAILMLVRKADGTKRLRISGGWDEYRNGYAVEETGPVPEDASMDTFHMWDGVLFLGNDLCSFNFTHSADGKWHFTSVQSSDSFGILYDGVENWEGGSVYRNDHVTYGVSPWNSDITQLDLLNLPRSYDEAISQLDASNYMFVNNPNPNDRLHLRTKPQKGAQSLGKFYNRTPVYVIEEKGDWAHVRIGNETDGLEGYMMTKFLTRDSVACAFPQKHIKESLHGKTGIAKVPAGETFRTISGNSWYIIGVVDDGWYVIMTGDGAVGYQLQNAFWDGNG